MPIPLPNGLTCPEKEDNNETSCQQIKDLFIAVDAIQSVVGTNGSTTATKITQTLPSGSWILNGAADCKQYEQTATTPLGVDTSETIVQFTDDTGSLVYLCYDIIGPTTLKFYSNTPLSYKVIYA